jgi:uncharacterized protein (TIGR03086 family)
MPDRDWQLLDEAYEILREAAAGVRTNQWKRPTPCADWTVAQVLQHAAMDQALYESAITGSEKPEGDAFNPTGDLGEDPLAYLSSALSGARNAFDTLTPGADGVSVPLPPYAVSARLAAGAASLDAAVHGWDIAVATGQSARVSSALARELRWAAEHLADPVRAWGAYAPAIEPATAADDFDQLLFYLGRRPDWTPDGPL